MNKKSAGVLLAISALPSKYGIGDFGHEAYEFADHLHDMGMKTWQILPINPLGYGNSPYQPYSSFAGEIRYLSLDLLVADGLLKSEELYELEASGRVNYEQVLELKLPLLKLAFSRFDQNDSNYITFKNEKKWLYNYSVFIALKEKFNHQCWLDWPEEAKNWIKDQKYDISDVKDEIEFQSFVQYIFNKQWLDLKKYVNDLGIEIMGDIPIYVGIDSLDVWENQTVFLLDKDSKPTHVAGVPPDYFSATGQRWGNPLYDWDYLIDTDFAFWVERLRGNADLFDVIRIDHFRAFDTYWKIPSTCETAIEGEWVEAPGYALFDEVFKQLPNLKIVAEDLGDMRPEVFTLRDHYDFPGMKIVQFTFDPNETNNDFDDRENMIIYTGTHDNQTIMGWYYEQTKELQKATIDYLKSLAYTGEIHELFNQFTFGSIAKLAILPIQDMIGLDDQARFNTPGTVGSPNWEYQLNNFDKLITNKTIIKEQIINSNRA